MATSGKKGKKNKGKAVPLQQFLDNGNTPSGVTQVAKKIISWASECELEEINVQLPTAPRATREFDDASIPQRGPFLAYISNLPFDTREEDIYDLLDENQINSLRLPRDDGENGRSRGFGYVEFKTRDDLINAVRLPDLQIKNRRIRIEVSNEGEQQRRGQNNRNRYEGFGSSDRESNWRRVDGNDREERRSGYGYNRDRHRDNSQDTGESWRTRDRANFTERPNYNDRRGGFDRREERRDDEVPRERPRLNLQPRTLPLPELITQPEEKNGTSDTEEHSTTPEPVKPKPVGVAAEKVFGSAKPVDTAAREKEIEERLERERQEKLKRLEEERERGREESEKLDDQLDNEKEEKDTRNITSWRNRDDDTRQDSGRTNYRKFSPDRRGPMNRRNDDRRGGNMRNSRDGPRDQRDFNRGNERDFNRGNERDFNRGNDRDFNRGNERDYNRGNDRDFNRGSDRDFNRGNERDFNRGSDRDFNRGNDRDNRYRDSRDRNDRYDRDNYNRERTFSKDKDITRDNRQKDDKTRRDSKSEKPMPKYQPPQGGPVLSSSNKYGTLADDDVSE